MPVFSYLKILILVFSSHLWDITNIIKLMNVICLQCKKKKYATKG